MKRGHSDQALADRVGADEIAAVVLAAGASTRMGLLKQLLVYQGRTFLESAVRAAAVAEFKPIVVVVGAQAEALRRALLGAPVEVLENGDWQSGMGSSITAGIRALESREYGAVAILLADQPLVTGKHLQAMRAALESGSAAAVAAQYNGTLGVPAIFRREMTGKLLGLRPESGARDLLRDPGLEIAAFPLPEAAMDIDTPEDFAGLAAGR